MLEHDRGIAALADGVPQRLAKPPRFRHPLLLPRRVIPVRRHAPVLVIAPVDPADRAKLHAVLASIHARDDRDRNASTNAHELDRLAAEPARATPDQACSPGRHWPRSRQTPGGTEPPMCKPSLAPARWRYARWAIGCPRAAQALLRFAPAAMTAVRAWPWRGLCVSISSSWKDSRGSRKR